MPYKDPEQRRTYQRAYRRGHRLDVPEWFWAHVQKASGCWLWLGQKWRKGYGKANLGDRSLGAHRLAWQLTNGSVPDGLQVLHHCDNPICVRPDHLWLGTNADNLADRQAKLRRARGTRNGGARLALDEVRDIRATTGRTRELARRYGVAESTISRIRTGAKWGWLP